MFFVEYLFAVKSSQVAGQGKSIYGFQKYIINIYIYTAGVYKHVRPVKHV